MADDIIRIRRDTLANWTSVNPVLAIGEISYDTTSEAIRIGDGSTVWLSLPEITSAVTAPINATYITQVADGTLTNEFALGSLATGIVKNTTTTGVLSIAVGADLPAHVHSAADITSGTVATARLGSGSATSSTVLKGDQTYSTLDLNFLSDVLISGLADTDVLQYETATALWYNRSPANANIAPASAKYIVQTATTGLSAEQSLGLLTTGIVKNTVTGSTGVLSTAVGADLPSHTHALSDLTVSGATSNQVPAWNGAAWVPVTPAAAVTDGDKGDITVSSSGTVWNIDAATIGLTELSATGTPTSANFLRGDNAWSTGVLVTDGDKGDITVSVSGTVWNIDSATIGITELSATGTPSASTFLRGDNSWVTPSAVLSDADYGDITVSSSGTVWNIDAATIGLTELSATGTPSASTYLRGDNTWAAVTGLSDGDKGDITVSSSGTVWNIDAGVVTTTELGGDITTAGKALLDDADAAAQRTTLGLPTTYASIAHVNNSTGIISGGFLSVASGTTFSITDGSGVVADNLVNPPTFTAVTWTGKTGITATQIASGLVSYVAIDNTGAVVQSLTAFTNTQERSYIVLGSLIHVNLTSLDAVNQFGHTIVSPVNQLSDLSLALGKFNFDGNVYSANGANLQLNKSAGKVHSMGSNWANSTSDPNVLTLASLTALSFQYRFSTGTNGSTGTSINPSIWDVAGVSTAVATNKWTVQRIYSFVSNNVKIQPGQTEFNSLSDAKASIQTTPFVTEPSIAENGILRGFLVVKQGATALNNAAQAFFYEAGKFSDQVGIGGQSVSSLQNAYDNAITPEILTDSTNGAVSIKRGSAADTDFILEGLNNAGTTTFGVTGNGVVTGVLTNCTGTASGLTAGNVTTNANLTGHITSSGNATSLGSFTSLELKTALTNETGSGAAVFADTPTLVTPILGTPTSGNLSNCTNLPTHTHALADLVTTGTAGATNFLRGDGAWTTGILVSDGDKGDITVSSSGTAWNIDAATVGLTELSATGTPSGSNFLRGDNTWAAASGSVSDGDKGDITVSSSGTVWDIDAATVGITELSATGTPSAANFLRGDNTWAAASGSVSDGDKGDITVSSSGTVWNIDAATIGTTELSATGTPSSSTWLRGDNTWTDMTFGDGSAAAPSVTHTGDTDTGMYFDAAGNKIYMATAGTLAMTIGASQGITFAANLQANGSITSLGDITTTGINYVAVGTAALPSISRATDADTGIWFGTNNVSLTTAGVNALTIGSTQAAVFASDVTAASGAVSGKNGKFTTSVQGFTGWFDHPGDNGIATTTVALSAASTSYAIPYVPQKTITISAIGAYTGTAVASGTCSLAIYASGADGWPSGTAALHCSAALTASAATTAISSAYSATLYAGTQYWLVYNTPAANFPNMRSHGTTALPKIFKTGTATASDAYILWGQTIATSRNFTTTPVTSSITHGNLSVPIVYVTIA
jgi:hypothetical protein